MEVCVICKKNETGRLMDGGWGKKLPVCGECLVSGRWRELIPIPAPIEPKPIIAEAPTPKRRKKKARK